MSSPGPTRCDTCGVWHVVLPRCVCGHPRIEHRIDLKTPACANGAGIPGHACGCRQFEETP